MEQDNHRSCQASIDFHFKKAKHGKFAVGRIHVNKHKDIVPQKYFTLNTVLKQNWPFQQPAFQYSLHNKEK